MPAVAIPLIAAAVSAGGTVAASKMSANAAQKAAQTASQRSPEEQGLIGAQTRLADQQTSQGKETFGAAMPAIKNTLSYYQTLLGGNRAARMNAVAPEAQDTAASYEGADQAVKRGYAGGGEKNQALAENARAKAGQVARLVTGVRPGAAQATAGIGANLLGSSGGFSGQAGNINANLLGNATGNRYQANQVGRETGAGTSQAIGKIFADLLNSYGKSGNTRPTGGGTADWAMAG